MARFKLLIGQHIGADPDSEALTAEQIKAGVRRPSRTYKEGDIVESDIDLAKRHGFSKFELVSGIPKKSKASAGSSVAPGGQVSTGFQATEGGVTGVASEPVEDEGSSKDSDDDDATPPDEAADGLQEMTVAQLKDVAEEDGISLQGVHSKGDIIEAIRASRRDD